MEFIRGQNMKKVIAVLLVVLLIVGTLSACGGGSGGNSLVGTWEMRRVGAQGVSIYAYIFNADGTGTRGHDEFIDEFTWTVDTPGEVLLTLDDNLVEDWNYSIDGRTLTLSYWTLELILTRAS